MKEYNLIYPLVQNDFERYNFFKQLYNQNTIHTLNVVLKNTLVNLMNSLFADKNWEGKIHLTILKSDTHIVEIIFDLNNRDVYYKVEVIKYNYSALIMLGKNNTNHVNEITFDEKQFVEEIELPTKILIFMNFLDINNFLNQQVSKITEIEKFKKEIIDMINKEGEKENEGKD